MAIAQVNILQTFPVAGVWMQKGVGELDLDLALEYTKVGYLEILSVDGQPYINAPCCATNHEEVS